MKQLQYFWAKLLLCLVILSAIFPLSRGSPKTTIVQDDAGAVDETDATRSAEKEKDSDRGRRTFSPDGFLRDSSDPDAKAEAEVKGRETLGKEPGRRGGRGTGIESRLGRSNGGRHQNHETFSAQHAGGCRSCKRNRQGQRFGGGSGRDGASCSPQKTGEGCYSKFPHACCDLKIVELFDRAEVRSCPARSKRSLFADYLGESALAFCCDPRIMEVIKDAVAVEMQKTALLPLLKDFTPRQPVFFSAQGLEPFFPMTADQFEIVAFKKVVHNVGSGYDPSKNVFKAPVDGLYRFHMRLHNNNGKAHASMALAHYPEVEKRTAEYSFSNRSSGYFAVNRIMKQGEQVVAVSKGPVESKHWDGGHDEEGLRFAEFSGFLLRTLKIQERA